MASAMLASLVSRMLARPLYETLAASMLSAAHLPDPPDPAASVQPESADAPGSGRPPPAR